MWRECTVNQHQLSFALRAEPDHYCVPRCVFAPLVVRRCLGKQNWSCFLKVSSLPIAFGIR